MGGMGGMRLRRMADREPPVSEKAFDEYHLYTLSRPATLHDRETKQVEFLRADGVQSQRLYVYDGAQDRPGPLRGWHTETSATTGTTARSPIPRSG